MNWSRSALLACVLVLGLPLSAQAATQIIVGDSAAFPPESPPSDPPRPLSIYVGDTGSLQAKRGAASETVANTPRDLLLGGGMFFGSETGPGANFWHLRIKGAPANDVTFGPRDASVVRSSNALAPGGAWTSGSPARVDTVMRVQQPAGVDLFEVKQTVLYVARDLSYRVVWNIRNMTTQPVRFIFGTSADLNIGSDAGRGVLIDGPSRFLGGTNAFTGVTGGIQEVTASQIPGEAAATPVAPWASYEEGDPFPVTRRLSGEDAFPNTINPLFMDNGVGVSFNDRATTGLAAGATARYEVIWHFSRRTSVAASPTGARDEAKASSGATSPLTPASDVGAGNASLALPLAVPSGLTPPIS